MKIIHKLNILLAMLAIAGFSACLDVIEPSLKDVAIQLVAPADQTQSRDYIQTFYWEKENLTEKYQIQIASPDFAAPAKFILDSTVQKNSFIFSLQPGRYQWRVRAVNSTSQSAYAVRNLVVDTAALDNQIIVLTSPADNFATNSGNIILQWQPLFSARTYTLQVDTLNFNSGDMVLETSTPATSYTFKPLKDGVYQWRVKGISDTAQSMFSVVFKFIVDRTPPAVPVLTSPGNDTTNVQLPVTLQWSAVAGAVKYKLYVYKSDGTLYDNSFPATLNGRSATFNKGANREKIYWQVTAVDEVGNESNLSARRNFTLQ